jgi:hypothetical protein
VQPGLERSWPRTLLKGSVRMSFRSVTIFNEKGKISFPNVQHLFRSFRSNLHTTFSSHGFSERLNPLSRVKITEQAPINSWKVSFFPRKNFYLAPPKSMS